MTNEEKDLLTAERYNFECAHGEVKGSNFPYHEVQRLPGYSERDTPALSASNVTNELARYLTRIAKQEGCPIPCPQRDISYYLWRQASRRMLPWENILDIVRGAKSKGRRQPIAHYFGYRRVLGMDGTRRKKRIYKMVRYITQEGVCEGCRTEFQYGALTVDRVKPGHVQGKYILPNVQLMCRPCNERKGANYDQ